MPPERSWIAYIEGKYGIALRRHHATLDIASLTATQSEIELVKYHMVRHEGYRIGEPILAYKGRFGRCWIVDGHTRARVLHDIGATTVPATLMTSGDPEVDAELDREAVQAGGGTAMHVRDIPIVDRLGEGSEAWERRRQELKDRWDAERQA